jgi:hypothetical protein
MTPYDSHAVVEAYADVSALDRMLAPSTGTGHDKCPVCGRVLVPLGALEHLRRVCGAQSAHLQADAPALKDA